MSSVPVLMSSMTMGECGGEAAQFASFFSARIVVHCPRMKVDLGIWDRLTKLILSLIVLAGLVGVVVWYLPLIRHNERMRRQILQKEGEIEQQQQTARELKAKIDAHRDPRTVERLVRERLSLAKTNETVIRFQSPVTNPPPSAPPK